MSDTPRTEEQRIIANARGTRKDGRVMTIAEAVPADFARQLERELAEARSIAAYTHARNLEMADKINAASESAERLQEAWGTFWFRFHDHAKFDGAKYLINQSSIDWISAPMDAALAKNPNPSGQLIPEPSVDQTAEDSGPVGLGPIDVEIELGPDGEWQRKTDTPLTERQQGAEMPTVAQQTKCEHEWLMPQVRGATANCFKCFAEFRAPIEHRNGCMRCGQEVHHLPSCEGYLDAAYHANAARALTVAFPHVGCRNESACKEAKECLGPCDGPHELLARPR